MSEPARKPDNADQRPLPLTIVALDDDADFRQFIRAALEAEGHTVAAAATPEECMRFCDERTPDVLLLDMKMGRYSGETVLQDIRRRWPKLCVIVITGYPTLDTMRRTFKQDVYDYLAKPFSMDELRQVLRGAAESFQLGGLPQDRLRRELGKQVRLCRTQRGWTLKELSEAAGVSISQLSSIERGAHMPSVESLLAVAGAMGAKPSEWLQDAGF